MNFDFDSQQYEFRDVCARFLAGALPSGLSQQRGTVPRSCDDAAWSGLAELGVFAALVPEVYDGLGLSFVDLALIVEELGRALAPLSITDTLIAADVIARFGSDRLKQRYLPRIAAGTAHVALATLEAEAGYDPNAVQAEISGHSATASLSGHKIMVANGDAATAFLITARSRLTGRPEVWLVDRTSGGIALNPHATLDPSCAMAGCRFDRTTLDAADHLIGAADYLFDAQASVAAGLQIGIAGRMLELAVTHAQTRVQFGKPIGSFQAIKHRCADMAVSHDGGRSAAYYAFWALAHDVPERSRAASVAKAFCGEAARGICNEGIQIHGGMGFTWELGLHHFLRRAKIVEFCAGDIAFHRERVVAATLAGLGVRQPSTAAEVGSAAKMDVISMTAA